MNIALTPPLAAAVAELYRLFAPYRAEWPLNVCFCPCCMCEEMAREMLKLPLAQLSAAHFYEYITAACDDENVCANEIKYFLPRWFELLLQGETVYLSSEYALYKLGCVFPDAFNDAERQAVQYAAAMLFERRLRVFPWQDPYDDTELDNLAAVLAMLSVGGMDVRPFLADWLNAGTPQAAAHYVRVLLLYQWGDAANPFNSGKLNDFYRLFDEWLQTPAHRRRFAALIADTDFPDEDVIIGSTLGSWRDAAALVFDMIA